MLRSRYTTPSPCYTRSRKQVYSWPWEKKTSTILRYLHHRQRITISKVWNIWHTWAHTKLSYQFFSAFHQNNIKLGDKILKFKTKQDSSLICCLIRIVNRAIFFSTPNTLGVFGFQGVFYLALCNRQYVQKELLFNWQLFIESLNTHLRKDHFRKKVFRMRTILEPGRPTAFIQVSNRTLRTSSKPQLISINHVYEVTIFSGLAWFNVVCKPHFALWQRKKLASLRDIRVSSNFTYVPSFASLVFMSS